MLIKKNCGSLSFWNAMKNIIEILMKKIILGMLLLESIREYY